MPTRALELLFRVAPNLLWELDPDGILMRVSHRHSALVGIDPEAWIGREAALCVVPADRPTLAQIRLAGKSGRGARAQLRLRTKDEGSLAVSAEVHGIDDGRTLVLMEPLSDGGLDRFRLLAEHVPSTLYLCRNDATYSMLYLSPQVQALTGWGVYPFLEGRVDFVSLYHPDDVEQIGAEVTAALDARRPFLLRYRLRHRDGSWRHVEERGTGVWDAAGSLSFLVGNIQDVTERVQAQIEREALERRLEQAQRLESLGILAGGVAHDFNNFLVVILGNIELATASLPPGAPEAGMLNAAADAATAASGLVQQMLTFAGRRSSTKVSVDFGKLVRDTTTVLQSGRLSAARIILERADGALPLKADPVQLQQLVMNLIINASDASRGGGRIWVRCRSAQVGQEGIADLVLPSEGLAAGHYALLEVEDEGHGINPEELGRVFEPFFSTKEKGHGLGLASALGTVQSHGGGLALRSAVGVGTTFRVFFPLEVPVKAEPSKTGPQHILVIEDEAMVRKLASTALNAYGYRVSTAENGRQGLDLLAQEPVDLILLDMQMPVLDGMGVLQELKEKQDATPVLVVSGFMREQPDASHALGPLSFLGKPYRPSTLVEAIQGLLGPKPS